MSDQLQAANVLAQADRSKVLLEAQAQQAAARKARIEELKTLLQLLDADDDDEAQEYKQARKKLKTLLLADPPSIQVPDAHSFNASVLPQQVDACTTPQTRASRASRAPPFESRDAVPDHLGNDDEGCNLTASTPDIVEVPCHLVSEDASLPSAALSTPPLAQVATTTARGAQNSASSTRTALASSYGWDDDADGEADGPRYNFELPERVKAASTALASAALANSQSSATDSVPDEDTTGTSLGFEDLEPVHTPHELRAVEMRTTQGSWAEIFDGHCCDAVQKFNALLANGGGECSGHIPGYPYCVNLVVEMQADDQTFTMCATKDSVYLTSFRFKVAPPCSCACVVHMPCSSLHSCPCAPCFFVLAHFAALYRRRCAQSY